jgi:Flp pilus assembly protein TadD
LQRKAYSLGNATKGILDGQRQSLIEDQRTMKLKTRYVPALTLTAALMFAVARPAKAADPSATAPLTRAQVMGLVAGGVANSRVAALVEKRGIAFDPTADFLTDLKSVGASDDLLNVVARARQAVPASGSRQAPATRPPARIAGTAQVQQLQAAEQQDRAAEMARPEDPDVHLQLAQALGEEGKWSEAAAQYAAVISNDPDNAAAHEDLGLALRKSGDIEGAIREDRRALGIDPTVSAFHDNLGVALSQKGDVAGAIAEFRQAIRDEPGNALAHDNLGSMLEQQRDLDAAIAEYRQAIALGGDREAQYNLATALELKGDLNGALAAFRQALKANPGDVRTLCALGGALEREGDLAGAFEEYAVARQLAPRDPTVQADYQRLAAYASARSGF